MAVNREFNWNGQQRVDIPHLRMVESGVRYDFDALSYMLVGQTPEIITGFDSQQFNGYTGEANGITFSVGGSKVIHPLATESGGIFALPSNLPDDVINPSLNPNVEGAWIPNAKNYLGIDFSKSRDSNTSDVVKFLNSNTDGEIQDRVPLARTISHKWVISALNFSYNKNICPVAIVQTTAQNKVFLMYDVRPMFGRLTPGNIPLTFYNDAQPYGWPGGRPKSQIIGNQGGDKSIRSLKEWMDAVMTRLWEIGGGSYWFSLTADRNVQMSYGSQTFVSTGEGFEVVSDNVHWKGVSFSFDNSTECISPVADQLVDQDGLTNLEEDGDCIYVDIDRRSDQNMYAQKGNLRTLGGSDRPGHRFVMIWRVGGYFYVRGQSYPIGFGLKLATTTVYGTLKSSLDLNPIAPVAAAIANSSTGKYTATCGGISHNNDIGTARLITPADLYIGRGAAAGDQNVRIGVDGNYQVFISGEVEGSTLVTIEHEAVSDPAYNDATILALRAKAPTGAANVQGQPALGSKKFFGFEAGGANYMAPISRLPIPPVDGAKYFVKSTKTWKAPVKLAASHAPTEWVYDSYTKTVTTTDTYSPSGLKFGPLQVDGVNASLYDRVLLFSAGSQDYPWQGIYRVIELGNGTSVRPILERTYDATSDEDFFDGISVKVTHGTIFANKRFTVNCENKSGAIDLDVTSMNFIETTSITADQICIMWFDGSYTTIGTSPTYEVA